MWKHATQNEKCPNNEADKQSTPIIHTLFQDGGIKSVATLGEARGQQNMFVSIRQRERMDSAERRLAVESLTPIHWLGVVMALVSAAVHIVLGASFLPHWMGILFVLAGGGYIGGVVLLVVDYRRRLLYLVGIPYTLVQILGWYVVNRPAGVADLTAAGTVDKVAQLILIAVLVVCYRRETS